MGWILDAADRGRLLDRFPPRFDVLAHHVTLWGHRSKASIPAPARLAVIGHAADASIEALVVSVDGTSRRPDGGTFHCTWSLDPAAGRVPKHSNDMLAAVARTPVDAIPFAATPGYVA